MPLRAAGHGQSRGKERTDRNVCRIIDACGCAELQTAASRGKPARAARGRVIADRGKRSDKRPRRCRNPAQTPVCRGAAARYGEAWASMGGLRPGLSRCSVRASATVSVSSKPRSSAAGCTFSCSLSSTTTRTLAFKHVLLPQVCSPHRRRRLAAGSRRRIVSTC